MIRSRAAMEEGMLGLRSLLVMAHPGHELRIHHWVELSRPVVAVLTDGSGGVAGPRASHSQRLLDALGARVSAVFAVGSDRAFYRAVMEGDVPFFHDLTRRLSRLVVQEDRQLIVSDAAEGYNPIHDLCQALAGLVATQSGRPHLEFLLDGPPEVADAAVRLELGPEAVTRKWAAARSYRELEGEVQAALANHGEAAFHVECLRRARAPVADGKPYYEAYGERMVAEGRYREVLRRRDHLEPLVAAVRLAFQASGARP